ncbi:hypothetical protein LJB90_02915 [Eubacteriales bacterium OttesenSCG-928-G02]|nr:hypothetical protein [Eubacteriales bacterium OttesenSCG-928-G02]
MGLFRRKDKPPKDTNSVEFKRFMANRLNGKNLRYILERENDTSKVIGKDGFISVNEGILSVICGTNTLFRAEVDTLSAWEFLSLEGATLTAVDMITGKERTVMGYYKYHRN